MGKHKNKKKDHDQEPEASCPETPIEMDSGESTEHKLKNVKKSKKSKKRKASSDNETDANIILHDDTQTDQAFDLTDNVHKKKKKKRKHKESSMVGEAETKSEVEVQDAVVDSLQSKRKSKKRKHDEADVVNNGEDAHEGQVEDCTIENIGEVKKKKKKSKKKRKDSEEDNKLKKEHSGDNETSKPGQNLDKIDMQPAKDHHKSGMNKLPNAEIGQWGSAGFENEDRQNKFYRLLGGFKNTDNKSKLTQNRFSLGSSFSKGNNINRPGGSNAMNKEQQAVYTRTLETSFERALSSNMNRGIGLGFQKPPEEGKKFHIDTNKSKSIKFDD